MTLITILLMAVITFTTRYLFIHPRLPVRLGAKMAKLLSFSAPAVLTAIWVPIIFIQQGELSVSLQNPYLIAATFAVGTAAKTKSIYLTMFIGLITFVLSRYMLNL
ncbi:MULTISPECIES: AzlD domain-containing protein [unclassified Colwellia]|jgi:branched-subunit amino acid transport protein|uniref:AzlD domain-containing protein n=1 Tax=unclassified Colwellia TaxID=196834 RepID=UPI000D38C5B1|nr:MULTISPECIES: AzlD domain-containing protein [unclassified Colwellia]AWB58363.1 branched-chain amino acid ABC transporter [Colwellia sp. Arc7-D]MBA6414794.1 AzlD domain-containing protein [Colwellia sp. 6M3]|tara:strand:+ start:216 stop:533 length:318 start_codon:yes stop_codon:yes gene_type:complete